MPPSLRNGTLYFETTRKRSLSDTIPPTPARLHPAPRLLSGRRVRHMLTK